MKHKQLMQGLLNGETYINNSWQFLSLRGDELVISNGSYIDSHNNPVRTLNPNSWRLATTEELGRVKDQRRVELMKKIPLSDLKILGLI